MDARARTVSDILHESAQYVIPLFQRSYSWNKEHWLRLNDDILSLMDDSGRPEHFLGPLVCTMGKNVPGALPVFQLIDGQQRLTTLTILLAALRDVAKARDLHDLAEEITEDYLVHKRKQDSERYKVIPRIGDRDALKAIVEGTSLAPFSQLRLVHAWRFFKRQMLYRTRQNPQADARRLFDTVTQRLSLVVITIDGENPYEIFESLNATGLPLAESDLIRNYVFMQVPIGSQEEFDRKHWHPLEQYFSSWGGARPVIMTAFYRDYLMRQGRYSRENCTYVDFKQQQKERGFDAEQQASDLLHFAPLSLQISKPEHCANKIVGQCLADIARMDIGTANALVLNLLDRHCNATLTEAGLVSCLQDLVSFVLRRTICGESTRAYGRWFVEAIGVIGNAPVDDLRQYWLQRGWPDDQAVTKSLAEFQFYSREPRKARLVLEALERLHGHKEQVSLNTLTVEHVMPQSITDDDAGCSWKEALGSEWESLRDSYLHVLGNLTLTGYNPELGKMSFAAKQVVYSDSHVDLNRYFTGLKLWNAATIKKRTEKMAIDLCRCWPRPLSAQPYDIDSDEIADAQGTSPGTRRNLAYWRAFLQQWDQRLSIPKPEPSGTVELVIPLDGDRGVSIHLWQARRMKKAVVYVRLEGRAGRRVFNRISQKRQEIDDQVEGELVWDWPVRGSFAVCEEDVDFNDRTDWELQHAWLADEMADLIEALAPELAADDPAGGDDDGDEETDRYSLRLQFWTLLLEHAKTRTNLHANRNPNTSSWIGGGIGRSGFSINYKVRENESEVELYIDLGKNHADVSHAAFAALRSQRQAIEASFGGPLEWPEFPGQRSCRIFKRCPGGYRSTKETWGPTHVEMVDAMIRLDKALRQPVQDLVLGNLD